MMKAVSDFDTEKLKRGVSQKSLALIRSDCSLSTIIGFIEVYL